MLIVLSPAKTLDETPTFPKALKLTQPQFMAETQTLAKQLKAMDEDELAALMGISPKLAALNATRFKQFAAGKYPCAYMFRGDVYDGLDIDTLPARVLPALQKRLRILSGMYGLLRPSDAMHPYRLEMGTALPTKRGKNLYAFWGERIAKALNDAAAEAGTDTLLNLASQEYSGAIAAKALTLNTVTVHFKERKGKQVKVVALFAKRARGRMARWVIEQNAQLKDLPKFKEDGYRFAKELSNAANLTFVR